MKTLEAHKDSHKEVSKPFGVPAGKAIWTCWRSVGPVRFNRQIHWLLLTIEQIDTASQVWRDRMFMCWTGEEEHWDWDNCLSGAIWNCRSLWTSEDFLACSGRGWEPVVEKCMFNNFAAGTVLPLSVWIRIGNELENTKPIVEQKLGCASELGTHE